MAKQMRKAINFDLDTKKLKDAYCVTNRPLEYLKAYGEIKRATVIQDYAYTITTRQDRTPAQVVDCGQGRYRYLTELECWRLQGYNDEDYKRAEAVTPKTGRYRMALYKQAGNSIAVPVLESLFAKIIL